MPYPIGAISIIHVEGIEDLTKKIKQFPTISRKSAQQNLDVFGKDKVKGVQKRIRDAPRVDTGQLLSGIHYRLRRSYEGYEVVVSPSTAASKYAVFVEKDTRPHWPPMSALQGWAERHGIPTFLVAKSIAEKGTKGIHMFEEELQDALPEAQKLANTIGREIVILMRWGK